MTHRILFTAVGITLLSASLVGAQTPTKQTSPSKTTPPTHSMASTKAMTAPNGPKKVELKEAQPGLIGKATVNVDNALATAQKAHAGTLVSERIEKRGDQIVYVFGIRGKKKVHHVMVDANTGALVTSYAQPKKPTKS